MSGLDKSFNIVKGSAVEKIRDDATKVGVLLLKTVEADATLVDRTTLTNLLGSNTEADFTNYVRKTGITATIVIDNTADTVTLDIPDQTILNAGGASPNALHKGVTYYEEAAADGTRIPMTAHTFEVTTDGSDLLIQVANFMVVS